MTMNKIVILLEAEQKTNPVNCQCNTRGGDEALRNWIKVRFSSKCLRCGERAYGATHRVDQKWGSALYLGDLNKRTTKNHIR